MKISRFNELINESMVTIFKDLNELISAYDKYEEELETEYNQIYKNLINYISRNATYSVYLGIIDELDSLNKKIENIFGVDLDTFIENYTDENENTINDAIKVATKIHDNHKKINGIKDKVKEYMKLTEEIEEVKVEINKLK